MFVREMLPESFSQNAVCVNMYFEPENDWPMAIIKIKHLKKEMLAHEAMMYGTFPVNS